MTVEADRLRKTRIVQAGSGFLSQHSKELLIGLGASERFDAIEVRWPDGSDEVFPGGQADRPVELRQGNGKSR